jgi:CheY-like chemotaxis protein
MLAQVLLIDDNPGDRDLVRDVLSRKLSLESVQSVSGGEEGLSFLRREGKYASAQAPSLVMLDLEMPGTDGRAVLAAVKSDPRLRTIPIVIFSTSLAPTDIAASYRLGANSYVGKPGALRDFISVVTSIGEFWFDCASLPNKEQ